MRSDEQGEQDRQTVMVRGRACPYDPRPLLGQPIGMLHCPACGCMVVAGLEHGMCLPNLCPMLDAQGDDDPNRMRHPGKPVDYEIATYVARELGLLEEKET